MDEFKLYEYGNFKVELENLLIHNNISVKKDYIKHYNHNHDPRNGQFTTGSSVNVSKVKGKRIKTNKNKQQKQTTKITTKEQAIENRELKYIQEHIDDFSSQELNELMNRINTESKFNDFVNKNSSKKDSKFKKWVSSPEFKLFATALVLSSLGYASYNAYEGMTSKTPRLVDKSNPYRKQFIKDIGYGAKNFAEKKIERKVRIKRK